ncbi:hypothetical protein BKA60DRAFT_170214 [Fusarium oxysporum]|nr:hypothetical protein BKA60DRAFT_170214 [Fusarium oxysporum]
MVVRQVFGQVALCRLFAMCGTTAQDSSTVADVRPVLLTCPITAGAKDDKVLQIYRHRCSLYERDTSAILPITPRITVGSWVNLNRSYHSIPLPSIDLTLHITWNDRYMSLVHIIDINSLSHHG